MNDRQSLTYRVPLATGKNGLGVVSIEAWPAVGGGLLVGIAEPSLAGGAPQRRSVKTLFLKVDRAGTISLILPYVSLEEEARRCIQVLAIEELSSKCQIETAAAATTGRSIVDLNSSAERSVQACAATARMLLLTATAEAWDLPVECCHLEAGTVHSSIGERTATLGEIAPDAALCTLPETIILRCGQSLDAGAIRSC